jgi:alkylmercury lyase
MENLKLTREDIVKAAKQFFSDDLLDLLASLFPTWRLLAKGLPVSVGQIAKKLDRPIDEVTTNLRRVEEMGFLDYDARGQILSFFGLSLNPTRHRLRKGSLELYADCAVDSLFIPAFVGQVITVESESPLSGAMIRLTITPKAIKDMEPPNAVLSWVVPGISLPGGI